MTAAGARHCPPGLGLLAVVLNCEQAAPPLRSLGTLNGIQVDGLEGSPNSLSRPQEDTATDKTCCQPRPEVAFLALSTASGMDPCARTVCWTRRSCFIGACAYRGRTPDKLSRVRARTRSRSSSAASPLPRCTTRSARPTSKTASSSTPAMRTRSGWRSRSRAAYSSTLSCAMPSSPRSGANGSMSPSSILSSRCIS